MKNTKRCQKCKTVKSISEFYKNRSKKDGLAHYCKSCQKICVNNYEKTEQGKTVRCKALKKYQKTTKYKVAIKRYAQSEKGKVAHQIALKNYYASEKGKAAHRAEQKHFRACNPDHIKATSAVNKAIKAGKLPRPDTLLCHYCPKPAKQYHHWHGYAPEHWLDVIPVCTECHHKCNRKIA